MTSKILVVDPVATNRIVLRARMSAALYEVDVTSSYRHAHRLLGSERYEAVFIADDTEGSSAPADARQPGFELLKRSKSDPERNIVAISMCDADAVEDVAHWEARCRAIGADDCMLRPVPFELLIARLRNLMRERARTADLPQPMQAGSATGAQTGCPDPAASVAIAAIGAPEIAYPTPPISRLSEDLRAALVANTRVFDQPLPSLTNLRKNSASPGVIILNACAAAVDQTIALIPQIQSSAALHDTRIILRLEAPSTKQFATAFDIGAHEVVAAEMSLDRLATRVDRQLHLHSEEMSRKSRVRDQLRLAIRDPLTGLHNRRYAMEYLHRLIDGTRQDKTKGFALLALDIDHFKRTNDLFGHAAGDQVLQAVAHCLQSNTRGGDLVARSGGEEFLVALGSTDHENAAKTAERIRHQVSRLSVNASGHHQPLTVTLSIGLAMYNGEVEVDSILKRADQALYAAKAKGRNTVSLCSTAA